MRPDCSGERRLRAPKTQQRAALMRGDGEGVPCERAGNGTNQSGLCVLEVGRNFPQ